MIVRVPADASLSVDGSPTYTTASVRTFETPELAPGKDYAYTFKAEYNKDGKTVSVTKRVSVSPGKTTDVDLTQATVTAVASK